MLVIATAINYATSALVAILARAKLCRLLLQSRDEAKQLPRPLSDAFLITMLDYGG